MATYTTRTPRLKVSVNDHRIAIELPPEVPDGEAELVVFYRQQAGEDLVQIRRKYLQQLFERICRRGTGRSREDIDRQLAQERASLGGLMTARRQQSSAKW